LRSDHVSLALQDCHASQPLRKDMKRARTASCCPVRCSAIWPAT